MTFSVQISESVPAYDIIMFVSTYLEVKGKTRQVQQQLTNTLIVLIMIDPLHILKV